MKITDRQNEIIKTLQARTGPISGEALGEIFGVSRQIIVKDIGVLKALGINIISSNRGYKLDNSKGFTRVIESRHTDEDIKDELNTIVDNGGVIVDVFISHPVYGLIRKDLDIRSRNGVSLFVKNMQATSPLKNLTKDVHYHTIRASSMEDLDLIEDKLRTKGYLN